MKQRWQEREHIGGEAGTKKSAERWDEERPSRCGIMLNKPTWKDHVRHFESILESLCSLRIFYVYLLRATRTTRATSPLPPYNPTPSPLFLPTPGPPRTFFFFSSSYLTPSASRVVPCFSSFSSSFSRSSSYTERRLHPRRWKLFTRHSEHAPPSYGDPVANPHPQRFDLVSPLPR